MGKFSLANLFGITLRESADDGSDFTNPDADYRRVFLGEDGTLKTKDSSGTVATVSGMSNPMTTAGDVIYGGASGTATRLAIGTAGQVLKVNSGATAPEWASESGGSGLSSGTAFPGTPSTGDRFRRTDIDYMVFFYDGTRWVTEQMFTMTGTERALNAGGSTTSPTRFKQTPIHHTLDIYAVRLDADWFVASTNNGSAFWTLDIKNLAESTTHVTVNTSAMSANTWTSQAWTTGAVIPASDLGLMWILTKTSTPGAFTVATTLYYRIIAT